MAQTGFTLVPSRVQSMWNQSYSASSACTPPPVQSQGAGMSWPMLAHLATRIGVKPKTHSAYLQYVPLLAQIGEGWVQMRACGPGGFRVGFRVRVR